MSDSHPTTASAISAEAAYQAATQMYAREHDRWNQWMLFFLAVVAAVFVAWKELKDWLPLWAACFAGAVLSGLWVAASASIRASTWSWASTLRDLETGVTTDAFGTYTRYVNEYPRLGDFWDTLKVFSVHPWRSVTRIVVLIVVLFTLTLVVTGVVDLIRRG